MEMWWIGAYAELWKLLAFLGLALVANVGFTHAAGFKRESMFQSTINQAVDAVAVGIVAAIVMLLVLNRTQPGDPLDSVLGMIVIQAVPLSIGASVANEVFGRRGERQPRQRRPRQGNGVSRGHGIAPNRCFAIVAGDKYVKYRMSSHLPHHYCGSTSSGKGFRPRKEVLLQAMKIWRKLAVVPTAEMF